MAELHAAPEFLKRQRANVDDTIWEFTVPAVKKRLVRVGCEETAMAGVAERLYLGICGKAGW